MSNIRFTVPHPRIPQTQEERLRELCWDIVKDYQRQFVGCAFVKRTDGSVRKMTFLYNPPDEEHVEGDHDYAVSKGLITVYDVHKRALRNVNLDGLLYVNAGGRHIPIKESLQEEGE